jgi:N utilization substance protein B
MATRRQAREWALQLLFQLDQNPAEKLDPAIAAFWEQQSAGEIDGSGNDTPAPPVPPKIRAFMERIVRGVVQHREAIDKRLTTYVQNWPLHRMGGVERNVMRLAFYELFFEEETPPVVCINEAVDLAKYFSNAEAGRFVNGVLDRAAKEVKRPARR